MQSHEDRRRLVTETELAELRFRTDPVLDEMLARVPLGETRRMLGVLFAEQSLPSADPAFEPLLRALPPVAVADPHAVALGQGVFRLYGPEALLVLGCYGLPAAYGAANGVQVVHRARRLHDDTERRLSETAQMLINVMVPNGLDPGGIGERAATKVRLMHALIRQQVRRDESAPWPTEQLGEPINQEDLAGTLLTFSVLVLDGLRKLGVRLSVEEERGYLCVWAHLAKVLGIDPRLVSTDREHAERLAALIGRRQFRGCTEGRLLLRDLIRVNESLFPVSGYATSLMNYFLDQSVFGVNLARELDLPAPNLSRYLLRARALQKWVYFRLLENIPLAKRRRASFAWAFTQRLVLMRRSGRQAPFEIPSEFADRWDIRPAPR